MTTRNVDMCCGQIADKAELIEKYNELEAKAKAFDAIVRASSRRGFLMDTKTAHKFLEMCSN